MEVYLKRPFWYGGKGYLPTFDGSPVDVPCTEEELPSYLRGGAFTTESSGESIAQGKKPKSKPSPTTMSEASGLVRPGDPIV